MNRLQLAEMSEKIRKRILLSLNGVAKQVFSNASEFLLEYYADGHHPEELGYKIPLILELQAKTCEEYFKDSSRKPRSDYDGKEYYWGWKGIKGKFIKGLLEIIGPKSSIKMIQEISVDTFFNFLEDIDDGGYFNNITEGYICNIRSKMFPNHPKRTTYAGQPDRNMIAV